MEKTLESNEIGVILRSFDINSLNIAAQKIIMLSSNPDVRKRCRKIAENHFSLDKAVKAYKSIYLSLLSKQSKGSIYQ